MPFPVIPLPLAFSLPDIAGVPDVIGRVIPPQATAVISTSLASLYDTWSLQDQKRQWGFFRWQWDEVETPKKSKDESNEPLQLHPEERREHAVLTSSSVHSIEVEENYAVTSAPQEDGAFTSYNKVKLPTVGMVRLLCDGYQTGASLPIEALGKTRALWDNSVRPNSIKKAFLEQLSSMVADTNLYELVTPEKTWERVNVVGYRLTRSVEQPHTILFADVRFVEVRSAKTEDAATPKYPSGAKRVDHGIVTPTVVGD